MLPRSARASLPLRQQLNARFISTTSDPALATWIQQMTAAPPKKTTDLIDLERAQQLCRVLPTRTGKNQVLPEWGTSLSKGHHLAYFWPKNENEQLGEDGSSRDYSAPAPYSRRMWAGGSFVWPVTSSATQEPQGILVGSSISEETSVDRIEAKAGMVFVHQLKEYKSLGGATMLKEIRMHVFRPSLESTASDVKPTPSPTSEFNKSPSIANQVVTENPPTLPQEPFDIFTYTPTLPLLFRFSALTFNAHRIHYDAAWARDHEGHSSSPHGGPVVHGPLSALLCVELVEQWTQGSSRGRGKTMRRFEYRATSPMYVGRETGVYLEEGGDVVRLWVVQDGKVGMTAVAHLV